MADATSRTQDLALPRLPHDTCDAGPRAEALEPIPRLPGEGDGLLYGRSREVEVGRTSTTSSCKSTSTDYDEHDHFLMGISAPFSFDIRQTLVALYWSGLGRNSICILRVGALELCDRLDDLIERLDGRWTCS